MLHLQKAIKQCSISAVISLLDSVTDTVSCSLNFDPKERA